MDASLVGTDALEEICAVAPSHAAWIRELGRSHTLIQKPLLAEDGSIVAEPLFWIQQEKLGLLH